MIGLVNPPSPLIGKSLRDYTDAELAHSVRWEMQGIAQDNPTPYLENLLRESKRREVAPQMPQFSSKEN